MFFSSSFAKLSEAYYDETDSGLGNKVFFVKVMMGLCQIYMATKQKSSEDQDEEEVKEDCDF